MIRSSIEELIRKATNAGFQFNISDARKAAGYLRKEHAAVGVTLPAIDPDGNECGFTICLDEGGFYSQYAEI
ncbi:MAG: hypothetical protein FWB98_03290 [Defluviitaleaceae bacterium]|nr:hypothetical protein [Defluviitaleaceae bacterium]